jgi:heat shock protein HslJ
MSEASSTMARKGVAAAVGGVLALGAACAGGDVGGWTELDGEGAEGAPVSIVGTVRQLPVEGGVWVIASDDGTHYNPLNLPEAFRVEGLAVEAEATLRDDVASIGMVGPLVTLIRIRENADAEASAPSDPSAGLPTLSGTSWRLVELAGAAPLEGVDVTLELTADGGVSGHASCNTYRGSVTLSGDSLSFGPLATTRMGCAAEQMEQESRYLAALRSPLRVELLGDTLRLRGDTGDRVLTFRRFQAPGGG